MPLPQVLPWGLVMVPLAFGDFFPHSAYPVSRVGIFVPERTTRETHPRDMNEKQVLYPWGQGEETGFPGKGGFTEECLVYLFKS